MSVVFTAFVQKRKQNDGRRSARHERRKRHSFDSSVKTVEQDRIAADIQNIDQKRDEHRHAGITLSAEQRRARVVQTDRRERKNRNKKIRAGSVHNAVVDTAEQKRKELPVKYETERQNGKRGGDDRIKLSLIHI